MRKTLALLTLASAGFFGSCGPGSSFVIGPDGTAYNSGGSFMVEGASIQDGMIWQLNRPIRLEFNHAVDPTSINFGSIQIRALDPGSVTTPVTGTFEFEAGSGGRVIIFRPACPTNDLNSNGAFMPGGVAYELFLPTQSNSPTVLRDTEGRSLELGLTRTFSTPQPSQPQFLDRVAGPPVATSVTFPAGLNLFTDSDPVVTIQFNQSIDGRSTNLNTNNLQLLYSDGEVGTAGANTFSSTNQLPGTLVLVKNCTDAGAQVEFHVTGILPVNRNLSLRLGASFTDLVGQANTSTVVIGTHVTPTLGDIYNDPNWTETDFATDEFRDDFDTDLFIDQDIALAVPAANIRPGYVAASFDYPGSFVAEENDFFLDSSANGIIITDSQFIFSDSNNRQHTVQNGVLNVNDFTIAAGAFLRGRGNNPLVIYATGAVDISGTLDVSGNNGTWPTSLNSPQFVEGGAAGECGGGRGGDASQNGLAETLRAEDGDAPFGQEGGGGGGGEGGFNADFNSTGTIGLNGTIVGGGGGGGFARTQNQSVLWTAWPLGNGDWRPYNVDNAGPDHIVSRQTAMVITNPSDYTDFGNAIFGAEPGVRGSAATVLLPGNEVLRGMEDTLTDIDPAGDVYNPAWILGQPNPFYYGSPTAGPDRGEAGPSVFTTASNDRRFLKDFYGARLMADGSVNGGSLLAPWAGSGGGGSGDSMLIEVWDRLGDGGDDPLIDFFPVVPFQRSGGNASDGWDTYRKGAGGGGGGGQLIIMAIDNIKIGATAEIKANGGIGFSGESLTVSNQGISGSGGGSGGHIILATSGKLDLSEINVGTAATAAQVPNLTPVDNIQAFGGRRGWAGPRMTTANDGNATFATGRGGAGANGIIQIHVPDPTRDIIWHPNAAAGIADYLPDTSVSPATDQAEEVLDLVSSPRAYNLVPFYSSQSRFVSKWIDTGAAELRLNPADFPDFGHSLLKFEGINTVVGRVDKTGTSVTPLADVATGSTVTSTFTAYTLTIPAADTVFAATPHYLRSPNLLLGYDILPDAGGTASFEIVDVAYNTTTKVMVLTTSTSDGPMTFALNGGNPTWSVKKKFFRVDTSGQKDSLPASTNVFVQFQVADEDPSNPNQPGASVGGWISDLTPTAVAGKRFIRYRVTFDANADGGTMDLASPLPLIDYIKIPFVW